MNTLYTQTDTDAAARILRSGGLVAVPTETVYGLAANGLDEAAVAKIYEVKGRPETKPISLLVESLADAEKFCKSIPEDAYIMADAFWPGPLTMIFVKSGLVPGIVTAGGNTVGIRCPAHPLTLEIIRKAGVPLAAPSANMSGSVSPKCAGDVDAVFNGLIDCIVDGGVCTVGVESTIVDMTSYPYRILRLGGLPLGEINNAIGRKAVI